MSRTSSHPEVPPAIEQDERWALVLRVASSRQFAKAAQLREILIYVCQRALTDPAAVIREHDIGCEALGRKSDFNPQEDNIVRVQISQVRKRLDEYFGSDGKDEPIHITIPKGTYVPHFEPRPEPAQAEVAPAQPIASAVRSRLDWHAVPVLSAIAAILAILCVYFALRPVTGATTGAGRRTTAQDPFWVRLFGTGQPAQIVVSDSCLVLLQDVLNTDLTVDEYVGGQYPQAWLQGVKDGELKSALQLLTARQYTSLADLNLSSKIAELNRHFSPGQASLRYSRHLNIRDFKTGNFILLGSRRGIPWVRLFEPQLNFAMEADRKQRLFYFRNKSPKPGEQEIYAPFERDGALETYADIALLPNLGNNGSVLLLAGISMVDTEAAGELLTRKDYWKDLSRIVGPEVVRNGYFEILVRTRAVAGAAGESKIVTWRVIQPNASNR